MAWRGTEVTASTGVGGGEKSRDPVYGSWSKEQKDLVKDEGYKTLISLSSGRNPNSPSSSNQYSVSFKFLERFFDLVYNSCGVPDRASGSGNYT
jgi:hypothetical protein